MTDIVIRDVKGRVRGRFFHPGPLDRAAAELEKAERQGDGAIWHLARALSILVAYLRERERR